jgi:hypothetical protein
LKGELIKILFEKPKASSQRLKATYITFASVLVFICVYIIQPYGWLIPPMYLLLFGAYILLLLLTREIDKDDWMMIKSLINKKSKYD